MLLTGANLNIVPTASLVQGERADATSYWKDGRLLSFKQLFLAFLVLHQRRLQKESTCVCSVVDAVQIQ